MSSRTLTIALVAVAVVALLVVIVVVIVVAALYPVPWSHVTNADVSRGGVRDLRMRVYRASGEELMITDGADLVYVLKVRQPEVGIARRSDFVLAGPVVRSKTAAPPLAPIAKFEQSGNLRVIQSKATFTGIDGKVIDVSW